MLISTTGPQSELAIGAKKFLLIKQRFILIETIMPEFGRLCRCRFRETVLRTASRADFLLLFNSRLRASNMGRICTRTLVPRLGRLAQMGVPISFLLLSPGGASAADLSGRVSILSGDTIKMGTEEIRLMGIDAPELEQTCWDQEGLSWDCGRKAAAALEEKIHGSPVNCRGIRRDTTGRLLAICEVSQVNLNSWLVSEGWALAFRTQSLAFEGQEDSARRDGKGMWIGAFEPPWIWRTKQPHAASSSS